MHDEQEQQKVSQLTTQYVTGRQLSKGPICLKEPFQDGAHHAEVVHKNSDDYVGSSKWIGKQKIANFMPLRSLCPPIDDCNVYSQESVQNN